MKLALHQEIHAQDVAYAPDVHQFMLSKWKKGYRKGRLRPAAEVVRLGLRKALQARIEDCREVQALERTRAMSVESISTNYICRSSLRSDRAIQALACEDRSAMLCAAAVFPARGS